jgi:hypothetical protein
MGGYIRRIMTHRDANGNPVFEEVKLTAEPTQEEFSASTVKLPDLLAHNIKKCMEDPAYMRQARSNLYVWYNAQPLENRSTIARESREMLDKARLVMEGLFNDFLGFAATDFHN